MVSKKETKPVMVERVNKDFIRIKDSYIRFNAIVAVEKTTYDGEGTRIRMTVGYFIFKDISPEDVMQVIKDSF